MKGKSKRKSVCTILVTIPRDKFHGAFTIKPWGIIKNHWKPTSQMHSFTLVERILKIQNHLGDMLWYSKMNFLEFLLWPVSKLDELFERPRDFWIEYYPSLINFVYKRSHIVLRTHLKKRMMIVGIIIFPEGEHLLQVAWDLISPCRGLLPPACTKICKDIKTKGLH